MKINIFNGKFTNQRIAQRATTHVKHLMLLPLAAFNQNKKKMKLLIHVN